MDKGFSYPDVQGMLLDDVYEYLAIMQYQDDLVKNEIEKMKGKK